MLDPRVKLGHIPYGDHNCVMKTLLNMLKLVHTVETSRPMPIDYLLTSSSHKCSKVMMQFMERQSNRSTTL